MSDNGLAPPGRQALAFSSNPVGEPFDWTFADGAEPATVTYHARTGLTFNDRVEWGQERVRLSAQETAIAAKQQAAIAAVTAASIGALADADQEAAQPTAQEIAADALAKIGRIDESLAELDRISVEIVATERARWPFVVAQMLRLVADADPRLVAELTERAPIDQFMALKDALEVIVVHRIARDAQAVAGVPPTLPTPLLLSPSTGDGGPDSGDAVSSSTDSAQ